MYHEYELWQDRDGRIYISIYYWKSLVYHPQTKTIAYGPCCTPPIIPQPD